MTVAETDLLSEPSLRQPSILRSEEWDAAERVIMPVFVNGNHFRVLVVETDTSLCTVFDSMIPQDGELAAEDTKATKALLAAAWTVNEFTVVVGACPQLPPSKPAADCGVYALVAIILSAKQRPQQDFAGDAAVAAVRSRLALAYAYASRLV
jgi:hypothetical protein